MDPVCYFTRHIRFKAIPNHPKLQSPTKYHLISPSVYFYLITLLMMAVRINKFDYISSLIISYEKLQLLQHRQ